MIIRHGKEIGNHGYFCGNSGCDYFFCRKFYSKTIPEKQTYWKLIGNYNWVCCEVSSDICIVSLSIFLRGTKGRSGIHWIIWLCDSCLPFHTCRQLSSQSPDGRTDDPQLWCSWPQTFSPSLLLSFSQMKWSRVQRKINSSKSRHTRIRTERERNSNKLLLNELFLPGSEFTKDIIQAHEPYFKVGISPLKKRRYATGRTDSDDTKDTISLILEPQNPLVIVSPDVHEICP